MHVNAVPMAAPARFSTSTPHCFTFSTASFASLWDLPFSPLYLSLLWLQPLTPFLSLFPFPCPLCSLSSLPFPRSFPLLELQAAGGFRRITRHNAWSIRLLIGWQNVYKIIPGNQSDGVERRSASEGRAVRAMPFGQCRGGSVSLIGRFSARLARQLTGYVVLARSSCGALPKLSSPTSRHHHRSSGTVFIAHCWLPAKLWQHPPPRHPTSQESVTFICIN